jgi:hypothetical protein
MVRPDREAAGADPPSARQDFEVRIAPLGFAHLLGYLVLGLGLYILSVILFEPEHATATARVIVLPMLLFGATLGFLRNGTRSGIGAGEVVEWWGLKLPLLPALVLKRDVHPLQGFREVVLGVTTVSAGDSGRTRTVYPVGLAREYGRPVTLETPGDFDRARRRAEDVARRLRLPLRDETRDDGVVRAPDELDRAVRDQVGPADLVGAAQAPEGCRSRLERSPSGLVIVVPPTGLGAEHVAMPVFWTLVLGGCMYYESRTWSLTETLFVAPVAAGLLLYQLSTARRRWRVEVSWDALRIQQRGLLLRRTVVLDAREIEELLPARGKVEVRSDRRSVRFGADLAPGEDAFLVASIRAAWAGGAGRGIQRPT